MKRMLIAAALAFAATGQVLAADLPPAAPAPPPRAPAAYIPAPMPVYNWSGFYIGVNGGYGFGSTDWTGGPGGGSTTGSFSTSGFLVGGTAGFNYQISAFVVGAEADIDWSTLKGTSSTAGYCGFTGAPNLSCETANNWLGTARGRVGFALDRVLVFGTAGAAFGNIQTGVTPPTSLDSSTKVGWTAGAGVEVAFAQNWTAKVEYLYVDLGNGTCTTSANCGLATPSTVTFTENLVRLGVNFKF